MPAASSFSPSDPPVGSSVSALRAPGVGDQLGRYRLEALIGEGAVGSVFRAVHVDLGLRVALKVLNPDLREVGDVLPRFFNEARAVNRVRHPNLVEISDLGGESSETPFLVMELLEGCSLTEDIQARAPMDPERVVFLADQVCAALDAVHGVDIVHRDLKSDNVFLVGDPERPQVKLLDFGVSKFLAAGEAALTQPGELMGTPQIMAPEQIRGRSVDRRVDVYAVGILLFEMLTRQHPYETLDMVEMLQAQMHMEPPRPSDRLKGEAADRLPPALDALVVECLAKDPDARVPDMATLRRRLFTALSGSSDEAWAAERSGVATRRIDRAPTPRGRRGARRGLVLAGLGVAALITIGLGVALWSGAFDRDGPSPAGGGGAATIAAQRAGGRSGPIAPRFCDHRLRTKPAGAAVYDLSDGHYLGTAPLCLGGLGGQSLLLRKSGFRDRRVVLSARPAEGGHGASPEIEITLAPRQRGARSASDRPSPRAPRRGVTTRRSVARPRPRARGLAPQAPRPRSRTGSGSTAIVDPFREQ